MSTECEAWERKVDMERDYSYVYMKYGATVKIGILQKQTQWYQNHIVIIIIDIIFLEKKHMLYSTKSIILEKNKT